MSNIGGVELLIIGIIGIFFFGNKKIKELARGLGEGSKELKKIKKDISDVEEKMMNEERGDY